MRISDAMRRLLPPGSLVLFLLFLTGVWVTLSPFAMTTQPSGQHWIASTINNVTIGGVLLVVSLLGILAYLVLALRDLLRETQAKQEATRRPLPANEERSCLRFCRGPADSRSKHFFVQQFPPRTFRYELCAIEA